MIGRPVVDISLDFDQSLGFDTVDGRTWTRITEDYTNDYQDLSMPTPNMVLGITYRWGRDRFIVGDFETGTMEITLNNDNGEWTPTSGVNTIGGDKLEPGMFVRVGYQITDAEMDTLLPTATNGSGVSTRALSDAETTTGYVDGRTWTKHGASDTLNLYYGPGESAYQAQQLSVDFRSWSKWMGRIINIEDRYDEGGVGAVTVVTCADLFADLSQYQPGALGTPRIAEQTSARVNYLWGQALNSTGSDLVGASEGGEFTVEASDLPSNYLEECRVAARAEGGATYVDHARRGRVTFRYANWLVDDARATQPQAVLGVGRFPIIDAQVSFSLLRLFNRIIYTNSSTSTNESDATSIADYSTRTLSKTVLNNVNGDLTSIAERDLAILKDAKLVITGIVLKPVTLWEHLLCAKFTVGDRLTVTILNNGWDYTQDVHVAGIEEVWNPAAGEWIVNLRVDSRDGDYVIEATA